MTNREWLANRPRPRPILDAFKSVGSAVALLGSVVTALVGWGVLSAAQGDAVAGLLGAIPGVVTLVTALLAAFGVVRKSEGQVTPLSDPRDNDGTELVPIPGGRSAPL
ncbi:hypothetical protein SUDANB95_05531 [Actinosynnema sp. ALI-1.44]